ncbi:MAG TPA: response regulator [Blastocatellia bacterium]|nr:response regulator [Blastocatellia bacterium]
MAKRDVSILIVEDEEPVRMFLANCLALDYVCVTANSAEEALDLLAEQSFQLVVTDLTLPEASGVDLCTHIRRCYPDTAVIAMSGVNDIKSRVEAIRQGALYFIEKPFNTAVVQRLVAAALNSQAASAARRMQKWSIGETFSVKTGTGSLLH